MADYMNPANYNNMIEGLNTFAAKTAETCEKLRSACTQCTTVLGQDDIASPKITGNAGLICEKYADLALEAKRIAAAMEDELNEYYRKEADFDPESDGGDVDDI